MFCAFRQEEDATVVDLSNSILASGFIPEVWVSSYSGSKITMKNRFDSVIFLYMLAGTIWRLYRTYLFCYRNLDSVMHYLSKLLLHSVQMVKRWQNNIYYNILDPQISLSCILQFFNINNTSTLPPCAVKKHTPSTHSCFGRFEGQPVDANEKHHYFKKHTIWKAKRVNGPFCCLK